MLLSIPLRLHPQLTGFVTIDVAADQAFDNSNNGNSAATQLSVTNDETKPTVTLSAATTSPVNGKFTITAEFSEDVTGFMEADITTDGTTSDFVAVDANTYTFSVSSAGAGATVDVLAGVASDAAGNTNTASNSLGLTFDIIPPDAPTIDLAANSDSGASDTDNLTNDDTPTIEGTAEANATVEVFDGATSVGATTADGSGNWSITPGSSLAEGIHEITAKATDAAGNESGASSSLSITIDVTAPDAPDLLSISDDTGSSDTDLRTNDPNILIFGTAESNATIVFEDDWGTTSADADGDWTLDLTSETLTVGPTSFRAKATDQAGNTSQLSDELVVDLDTSSPDAPVISGITTDSGAGCGRWDH